MNHAGTDGSLATVRASRAILLAALVVAACARSSGGSVVPSADGLGLHAPSRVTTGRGHTLAGKFQHVVVIVEENRTVDNMFNGFPGADTVRTGDRDGKTVRLIPVPLQPGFMGLDHSHKGFVADYDDGKMDGFDHAFSSPSEGTAYAYVRPSNVATYWTYAKRFTLADEVFQAEMAPSLPAHLALVAAQDGHPFAIAGNGNGNGNGPPGCFGTLVVLYVDLLTPFPGTESKGPGCIDVPSVFDLLDARGIRWRYYAPDYGIGQHLWSAPDYIRHIALGPDHANLISPETQVLSDIKNHALPPVSYVVPQMCTSDHPYLSTVDPLGGPLWVAEIANAIGTSAYWRSTLILVTWDDWGGWYDHVVPSIMNADQLGFRTPLLVISAYPAKPGVPDHTARNQASIITAIESIFGLGSLGQLDAQTDDLSADFDFSAPVRYGSPLPAATPPPKEICNVLG